MANTQAERHENLSQRPPTPDEVDNAATAAAALARARRKDGSILIGDFALSESIGNSLIAVLRIVADGDMVTVVPTGVELTTHEAAKLLNVSRPHLIKLLDRGEIPFAKTGTHRRIGFDHLMAYKERRSAGRRKALKRMQRFTEEFEAE